MTTIKTLNNTIDAITTLKNSKAWVTAAALADIEAAVNKATAMGIGIAMPAEVDGTAKMMADVDATMEDAKREMDKRRNAARRNADRRNAAKARREAAREAARSESFNDAAKARSESTFWSAR